MQESQFASYDELPLFLNAKLVAQTLGTGLASAYGLMYDEGFPSMRVGSRFVVPKDMKRAGIKFPALALSSGHLHFVIDQVLRSFL